MAVERDGGAPMVSPHGDKRCGGRARGARQDKRKVGGKSTPALAIASSAKERYCSRKRQDVLRALEEKASLQSATVCARVAGVLVLAGIPSSWGTWRTLLWTRCDFDESCI